MRQKIFLIKTVFVAVFLLQNVGLSQTNTFPSTGNVGIGTISPTDKLHFEGQYGKWLFHSNGRRLELHTIDETINHYPWIGFYDHNGLRGAYFGNGEPGDHLDLRLENSTDLAITGGNVGIGTNNPVSIIQINGLLTGGIGAKTTGGVENWNDVSNIRSGSGHTLLRGSASNGPFNTQSYFHPFNFEYISKDGSGNITQLAIPYGNVASIDDGIYMRGRYSNSWSDWVKLISENTNGNVGIGTNSPDKKLTVNGTGKFNEIIVDQNTGADFVFEAGYDLPDLNKIESFIHTNHHLPEIPSAEQMKKEGVNVGDLQMKLLQKIEELTLHLIKQEKENQELRTRVQKLEERLSQ